MSADRYHASNGILYNLLHITNANDLREYDWFTSTMSAPAALRFAERANVLDCSALKGIHGILFDGLYGWAGKVRTVPLHKGETTFAPPLHLEDSVNGVTRGFTRAVERSPANFTGYMAELWGRLNRNHPFPEGNGRAIQIFLMATARRHSRDINWQLVDRWEEIDAAKASIQQNFRPYERLLIRAMYHQVSPSVPTQYFTSRDR